MSTNLKRKLIRRRADKNNLDNWNKNNLDNWNKICSCNYLETEHKREECQLLRDEAELMLEQLYEKHNETCKEYENTYFDYQRKYTEYIRLAMGSKTNLMAKKRPAPIFELEYMS